MSKSLKNIGTSVERINANTQNIIARNRAIISNNKVALTVEGFMDHTMERDEWFAYCLAAIERDCKRLYVTPYKGSNREFLYNAAYADMQRVIFNSKYTKDEAGVRAYCTKENISATEVQISSVASRIKELRF